MGSHYEKWRHSSVTCKDCVYFRPNFAVQGSLNWKEYVGELGDCLYMEGYSTGTIPLDTKANSPVCRRFEMKKIKKQSKKP